VPERLTAVSTFEPLSEAEQNWLQDQLRLAAEFAGEPDALPSLQVLDRAWSDFIALGESANDRANAVVLCVGAAFGEHLVRHHGFSWCISTDEWGTGIAVRARPGKGDVTIFPLDYVSKRWETREGGFLVASIAPIVSTVHESDTAWNRTH
jgi:hypothetical protein